MENIFAFFSKNQSVIYKIFLFLISTLLIIYLLPKGGQFKYNFQKGKPWQYENLYAPFSFTIKKDKETLAQEEEDIRANAIPYLEFDSQIATDSKVDLRSAIGDSYLDSLYVTSRQRTISLGEAILDRLYRYGVMEEEHSYLENQTVYLKKGNEVEQEGDDDKDEEQDAMSSRGSSSPPGAAWPRAGAPASCRRPAAGGRRGSAGR